MEILRLKYEEVEHAGFDGGGSEILHYKGKPFTGFEVEYYDSDALLAEYEYQDGYLEGWQRGFYENGQVEGEYKLHNNEVVSGTYKTYDENGNYIGGW